MTTTHGEKSHFDVDLRHKNDYIFDRIDPVLVRSFARLDDEALRLAVYLYFCELARGNSRIPRKKARVRMAEILIKQGKNIKRTAELTGISKATYYRLKRIING